MGCVSLGLKLFRCSFHCDENLDLYVVKLTSFTIRLAKMKLIILFYSDVFRSYQVKNIS